MAEQLCEVRKEPEHSILGSMWRGRSSSATNLSTQYSNVEGASYSAPNLYLPAGTYRYILDEIWTGGSEYDNYSTATLKQNGTTIATAKATGQKYTTVTNNITIVDGDVLRCTSSRSGGSSPWYTMLTIVRIG